MNATENNNLENNNLDAIHGYCYNCGETTWHVEHGMLYDDFTDKLKVGHFMVCNECGLSVPDFSWLERCRKRKKIKAIKEENDAGMR